MDGEVIYHCPYCRRQSRVTIRLTGHRLAGYTPARQSGFQHVAAGLGRALGRREAAPPQVRNIQKKPVGRLTGQDVTSNLADAGVVFGYATAGVMGLSLYYGWPLALAPAAGFAAFGLRYYGGMKLARRLLIETVETVTNRDLNGDGYTGPVPKAEPPGVKVEAKSADNSYWQFAHLPGEPEAIKRFAGQVLAGGSFAERQAVECGLPQITFGKLRDEFIANHWAKWNHPTARTQGVTLRESGWAVLDAIAASPLPGEPAGGKNSVLHSTQHAARTEGGR